jgi:sporulation protein YlmC with PRC-barrel domain
VVAGGTRPDTDLSSGNALAGKKVFSSAGEQVGTLSDVYFEEDDGRVVGFEISSGVVNDAAGGRKFLPAQQLDHVGDEIVYVRPETADSLKPAPGESGGAIGAAESIKAKVSDAMQPEAGAQPQTPGSDLVGRRAGIDVTDADSRIIVANGQEISQEHVERAAAASRTDELRAAADRWSAAERDRVISGTAESITDAAGSAWDSFLRKISEITDETGRRMSEQQTKARLDSINDAVGRPVTKVILDRSDDVILNLGDIITHEAVQRAYDAGTLDTLLGSVYKGEVAFERDEMKAPGQGTSTVEKASGGADVVEELRTSVDTAETERREASDQQKREAEQARERRETERQERARSRDEAAEKAASGEPLPDPSADAAQATSQPATTNSRTTPAKSKSKGS